MKSFVALCWFSTKKLFAGLRSQLEEDSSFPSLQPGNQQRLRFALVAFHAILQSVGVLVHIYIYCGALAPGSTPDPLTLTSLLTTWCIQLFR